MSELGFRKHYKFLAIGYDFSLPMDYVFECWMFSLTKCLCLFDKCLYEVTNNVINKGLGDVPT